MYYACYVYIIYVYIYIYIYYACYVYIIYYICCLTILNFEEGTILKGQRTTLDETRCEEVLIKKVFH